MRATWHGTLLAESDVTVVVDGYTYFPPESVRWERLVASPRRSVCAWKGEARYWSADDGAGNLGPDVAWSYPEPSTAARHIAGWVGFWRGVRIED